MAKLKECNYEPGAVAQDVVTSGKSVVKEASESVAKQWSILNDQYITAVCDTFRHLEPGYYTIGWSQEIGMYFQKEKPSLNKLYRMPNKATNVIMDDIDKFWTLEERYKKYNRVFRRNYLLYSAPGTGKTSLINLMSQDLIDKYQGYVFNLTTADEIKMFTEAVKRIRQIEGDSKRIIAVIEDIDNFIGDEHNKSSLDTHILNILDGNFKMSGVVIIATTNYIERIQARYKNRPSRFDRVVEFELPNDECRKMFLEKTVPEDDLKTIDINKWVEMTDGYTIDHLNELILLYFVHGHSEDEAFESMSTMVKKNNKLKNSSSVHGTSVGF